MPTHKDTLPGDRTPLSFPAEMLLQAAFFAAANPLFVIEWHSRRILAASESVERVFGYRPEEIRDATTEFLHVDADSFRRFGEMSEQVLSSGHPIFHCNYRMKRRDGTVFETEHIINLVSDSLDQPLAVISIVRDLSEKSMALLLSGGPEPDFRLLSENIPGGLFQRTRTPDGRISYTYMCGILFHQMGVDTGRAMVDAGTVMERIHPDDRRHLIDAMERTARTLSIIDLEVRVLTLDDQYLWVRTISQPRRMEDGSVIWDGILLDITRQRQAEDELSYLAMYDPLTGLPNVRFFDKRVDAAIDHARESGTMFLVAVVNIERFYTINERLGYAYGDSVLRTIAEKLVLITSGNNMAARFQGDEFLVLFQDLASETEIHRQVSRLQAVFREAIRFPDETTLSVKVKVGMSVFPGNGDSAEELRRSADTALNHARRSVDFDHVFYSPDMTHQMIETLELEEALRDAIDAGNIEPYYQPQYNIDNGCVCGFETLARWPRNGQTVSPARFIPLAEQSGLIHPLGRLFTDKVFTAIGEWKQDNIPVPPIAINFSAHQIRDPDLVHWLIEAIDRHNLGIEDITIEITESAFLLDFAGTRDILYDLHDRGVRLSMDDFGTGFSSLSYLSQLPFAEIKIDQTFIALLEADAVKAAIVRGIIDLAHALGLRVIAEGIETVGQLQYLRDMRCDAAQGYLFARPAPAGTFLDELRGGNAHPVFGELRGRATERRKSGAASRKKSRKKTAKKTSRKTVQ